MSSLPLALVLALACGETLPTMPTAASATQPAATALAPEQVLATWEGGQLTWSELEPDVAAELRNMEIEYRLGRHEVLSQALERKILDALLEAEVERQGLEDVDALLKVEIEDKVPLPTEAEVATFYPVVQRQLGGATLEEAAPWLRLELLQQAQAQAFTAYVTTLREAAGVEASLPYPDLPRVEIPVLDHDPVRGPDTAPVTIVQFAEYQCYYCNKVLPTLQQLTEAYPTQVRMVFKDYPLSGHGRAMPAAVAAHCAGEQEKYWEMYEVLLANQQALEDDDLQSYASQVGVELEPWSTCMESGTPAAGIEADMALAQQIGVQATPTFYVNGIVVAGAQPYSRFADIIDRELGR